MKCAIRIAALLLLAGSAAGEAATIEAERLWNATMIQVVAGHRYRFEARGRWEDSHISTDPDGYTSPSWLLRRSEWMRRAPDANWFVLICSVDFDEDLLFVIGSGRTLLMPRSGLLTCFANDVKSMYWNNRGAVELTVTEVE